MQALTPIAQAAHAFLAPSSAHRWVFCPGSARLEAMFPETEERPEAAEGTAAHWVALECMLLDGHVPAVGSVAPNGVHIDETMIEAAHVVYTDVVATLGPNWRQMIVVERRVSMAARVHAQNWGTPDIRAWQQLANGCWVLHIWDFKYGHKLVEAYENWQCIDYGVGIMEEAGVNGLVEQNITLSICVIQPRAHHREGIVRRWIVKATDVRLHVNRLKMSADEACGPNPKCYPEPSACEDCRGRHACEANQRQGYRSADIGHAWQPLEMTPEALGLELRQLERAEEFLSARITGLKEHAVALLKRGTAVPWYAMESTPGNLAWTKPVDEVLALGQLLGKSFAKPTAPITPTQAKAAAPQFKELIDSYASRPTGAAKLVSDDGTKARRVFGS